MLSFQGGIKVSSYTASKSGVMGMTKLLSCEWASYGINVNAIAPGYMSTANTEPIRNDLDRNRQILERIPAGNWEGLRTCRDQLPFFAQMPQTTCME